MRTISSLNHSAALVGALVLFAASTLPVHAQSRSNSNGASAVQSAAPPVQRSDLRAGTRMICIRGEITGSRIQRQVCKTEAEWRATGEVPGEVPGADRRQR